MRTPKGMIRAFLTPEEISQLEFLIAGQITDLQQEISGIKSEAAKNAIRHVVEQLEQRHKAIRDMRAPAPKRIGRPRGSKNSDVKPIEPSESPPKNNP